MTADDHSDSSTNGQVDDDVHYNQRDSEFRTETYNEVAARANLVDIRMIWSNFNVEPQFFDPSKIDEAKFNLQHKVSDEVFDSENGYLSGQFQWEATAKQKNKHLLKIKAVYFIMYKDLEGLDPTHTLFYLRKVGKFATYPYFRALASFYNSESQANIPPLPVLKDRVD